MSTIYFDCRVCGRETGSAHSGSDPDAQICEDCEQEFKKTIEKVLSDLQKESRK